MQLLRMGRSTGGHVCTLLAVCALLRFGDATALASPNLVANGDLEQPRQMAESRLSPTENEVIFEIAGESGFGRVVARGTDAARELQKGMQVGYIQVPGSPRGLVIDAREVEARANYEITVWFDLRGQIRPNRQYAYSVLCLPAEENKGIPSLQMIAPAIWADGKLIGSQVDLTWPESGGMTMESATKRGVVKTPDFRNQTGGQWLVLKLPQNFKDMLYIVRVSLRELNESLLAGEKPVMPTPTRYINVDDILEEDIAEALPRATEALQNTQSPDGFWQAGTVEESVQLTASILDVLARRGVDLTSRPMKKGLDWLAQQEVTSTAAIADRMIFLSRYGRESYRQTIAKDLMRLTNAQFDDGGWNDSAANDVQKDRKLFSTNAPTISACLALYEAHYAGFKADPRTWRKAAAYWRDAQARDGGYRATMDRYGGLGEATTIQNTAIGLTGLLITLDMAFADGATRCAQYLSNTEQRTAVERGMNWMEEYYDEYYKMLPTLDAQPNPFFNAGAMLSLSHLSGVRRFRDKDVFRTEAESVMRFYDPTSGLFAGSLAATSYALFYLNEGGAPIVFQRLILGSAPEFALSRDAAHLARYLIEKQKRPLNWSETDLDAKIEDWLKVPVLYVHAAGEQEVTAEQWRRMRDYCFNGGAIVFNVAEDNEAARAQIESGLKTAFPEYSLSELGEKDLFWGGANAKPADRMTAIPGIRTISNGLKHMVFVLPQDWSCRLNTFKLAEHPETFGFFDRLMTYTLDGELPRSAFLASTWDLPAKASSSARIARMEVGAVVPAYPDLVATLDRMMHLEYRLALEPVSAEDPAQDAPLLWISCAGPKPLTAAQQKAIRERIDGGTFVFVDVLSGNPNWAETMRSEILRIDDALRMRKLPASHPLLSGRLHETFGYDVRIAKLRLSLREEHAKLPRMDAYVIEKNGTEVGMFSTYDVGSGVGHVLFPECRGVMPHESRQVAANVLLYAMQRKLAAN